ncbi:hypothetical protein FNF31_01359 [Cafeteria roenbergensis]|uniref:Uncharacterized protein n=1 Tax=Cafeteria roenbergensis TaxID=33653 RepID=A0A5A8DS35_CAFRO|nr:hypothetical protein FNF31_01359 [Cafeteria roenbergensis]
MGAACCSGPSSFLQDEEAEPPTLFEYSGSRLGLLSLAAPSAAGSPAYRFIRRVPRRVLAKILAFAADNTVHFDPRSLPDDLGLAPRLSVVGRLRGDTGMRSCMISSAYPTLWARFQVKRLHPSRFLHIGLARAWTSSSRRLREAELPLDRAGGFCFKLSDGCFYSPDGSKWSTDYADSWGFDEEVKTVGVYVDFPRAQRIPAGKEAARLLRTLQVKGGAGSESAGSADASSRGTTSVRGAAPLGKAAGRQAAVQGARELAAISSELSASPQQIVATLSAAASVRGGAGAAGSAGAGCILFTVNGRIVFRGSLVRQGRERKEHTIKNLDEARARAVEARRNLAHSYKVNRNRLRGAAHSTWRAPDSASEDEAMPDAGARDPAPASAAAGARLATIAEASGDDLTGGRSGAGSAARRPATAVAPLGGHPRADKALPPLAPVLATQAKDAGGEDGVAIRQPAAVAAEASNPAAAGSAPQSPVLASGASSPAIGGAGRAGALKQADSGSGRWLAGRDDAAALEASTEEEERPPLPFAGSSSRGDLLGGDPSRSPFAFSDVAECQPAPRSASWKVSMAGSEAGDIKTVTEILDSTEGLSVRDIVVLACRLLTSGTVDAKAGALARPVLCLRLVDPTTYQVDLAFPALDDASLADDTGRSSLAVCLTAHGEDLWRRTMGSAPLEAGSLVISVSLTPVEIPHAPNAAVLAASSCPAAVDFIEAYWESLATQSSFRCVRRSGGCSEKTLTLESCASAGSQGAPSTSDSRREGSPAAGYAARLDSRGDPVAGHGFAVRHAGGSRASIESDRDASWEAARVERRATLRNAFYRRSGARQAVADQPPASPDAMLSGWLRDEPTAPVPHRTTTESRASTLRQAGAGAITSSVWGSRAGERLATAPPRSDAIDVPFAAGRARAAAAPSRPEPGHFMRRTRTQGSPPPEQRRRGMFLGLGSLGWGRSRQTLRKTSADVSHSGEIIDGPFPIQLRSARPASSPPRSSQRGAAPSIAARRAPSAYASGDCRAARAELRRGKRRSGDIAAMILAAAQRHAATLPVQ